MGIPNPAPIVVGRQAACRDESVERDDNMSEEQKGTGGAGRRRRKSAPQGTTEQEQGELPLSSTKRGSGSRKPRTGRKAKADLGENEDLQREEEAPQLEAPAAKGDAPEAAVEDVAGETAPEPREECLDDDDLDEDLDEDLEEDELDADEAVDQEEPDEDAPVLRHDEYIDPEERAKLEEASAELEQEEAGVVVELADIPHDKLDVDALKVVSRLRRFGHEVYFVGGCVRDLLLGLAPKDFDLATSARPEEIKSTFSNCRLIGRRFRLAHVYFRGGKVIETATFRRNPRQEDDLEVEGDPDLYLTADNVYGTAEEDARRRDFTINALFYDASSGKLLDFVGGKEDLEKGLIRTVGDPAVRMPEDPVRILRAVRFAAKLGFHIDEETWAAMKEHVADIPKCPAPRVTEETLRLLRSGASRGAMTLMRDLGALEVLLPSIAEHLAGAGDEEEARFFALLDSVDEWTHAHSRAPDDSVLLAALLSPLFAHDGMPTPRSEALDELLSSLFRDARLPRKLAERVRLILGAQRIFAGQRKRRTSPNRFLRQSYAGHAMALFDIRVRAWGQDYEAYRRWEERLKAVQEEEAPEAKAGNGGTRRRRRRRTTRKRR
ncbi:MAG: polynucleotide adenylyltransferase PcnB [Myxococcota bacterium]